MALLKDLIVQGASRFIDDAYFSLIKSGTWNGTAIDLSHGGTAGTTTANKILVSTSTNGTSKWSDWSSVGLLKTNNQGVISIDTNTYLTGNQTITLTGAVTGSGTTSIATTYTTVPVNKGGTNITSWTAYAIPYASAATTISQVSPNTSTTRKFLRMVGNGTSAASPAWDTVTKSDVGLSNVENTKLSTWAGSANITTVGTISSGTWLGTAISVVKGGTGLSSIAQYSLLYASAANTLSALTPGTGDKGKVLQYKSDGTGYEWVSKSNNSGTVTKVSTGTGLTGGDITTTGTISINSTYQSYISHGESAYNTLGLVGTDVDGIINRWEEVKDFLNGITLGSNLASILSRFVSLDTALTITGAKTFSLAINGDLLGNATTADRLKNARTISLTGSVTGYGAFDGSGNLSIATTTNHTHSYVSTSLIITIAGTAVNVNGGSISAATIGSALTSSAPAAYATSAGNADTVDNLHASDFIISRRVVNPDASSTQVGNTPFNVFGYKGAGYPVYTDPEFASGSNSVYVYNNSGGETVTITRGKAVDNFGLISSGNNSGYVLKITSAGIASPGIGGFYQPITSRANAVFILIFRALIPEGRSVVWASNPMGTSYQDKWITSTAGTGKWEWYGRIVHCGSAGTFSTGGHVYLDGTATTSSSPVIWYLAYCNCIDITNSNYDGLRTRYADNSTTAASCTGNAATATNVAWSGITSKPTTISGYGITDASASTHTHSVKINGDTKTIAATGGTAVDLGSYLPLAGGTLSSNATIAVTHSSNGAVLKIGSNNVDTAIWRVYSSDLTYGLDSSIYGFTLKYLGSGSGNDNKLVLIADNQYSTRVTALSITQDGIITLSGTPKVGTNTIYHSGNFVAGTNYVTPSGNITGSSGSCTGNSTTATYWKMQTLAASTDLNTMLTSGYYANTSTTSCSSFVNGPSGRTDGEMWMDVRQAGASSYGSQTYYARGSSSFQIYTRTWSNSTFSSWVQLLHTGNISSYAVALTGNQTIAGNKTFSGTTSLSTAEIDSLTAGNLVVQGASSLGTVTSGTWNASTIAADYLPLGGTDSGTTRYVKKASNGMLYIDLRNDIQTLPTGNKAYLTFIGALSSSNNNKSNSATTNGNTYMKIFEDNTLKNQYKISGSGSVSVASDANGNITITGITPNEAIVLTATNYSLSSASWTSASDLTAYSGTFIIQIKDTNSTTNKTNYYSGVITLNGATGRLAVEEIPLSALMATGSDTEVPTRIYAGIQLGFLKLSSLDASAVAHNITVKILKLIAL